MKIEAAKVREHPMTVTVDFSPRSLELEDPEYKFQTKVTGTVTFNMVGDQVHAEGELQTEAITTCVRCLKEITVLVRAELSAYYENNPELLNPDTEFLGSEDAIISYYDGDVVVPDNQFREAIMSELPALPVCSEQCKGLCVKCGTDLNETECGCDRESDRQASWKAQMKNIKLKDQ